MLMWIVLSSAFLAFFLLIRAIFGKKIKSIAMYVLWILVAARLLIPTYIPVEIDLFPTQITPTITYQVNNVEETVSEYFVAQNQTADLGSEVAGPEKGTAGEVLNNISQENQTVIVDDAVVNNTGIVNERFTINHPFQFVWSLGILAFACYFIISNARLYIKIKRSRVFLEEFQYAIPVYYVKWLSSPSLIGIFKPAIYLNQQAYEAAHREFVIEHELMHYKHRDSIWMLVQTICLCIHWFNPLVWVAAMLFRRDCECACDEVIANKMSDEERVSYGRTLLEYAEEKWHVNTIFSTSTSMSMEGKTMKKRVSIIIGQVPKRIINVCISIVLVIMLFAGSLFANTSQETKNSEANEKYWNETYVVKDTTHYYCFYPDGTLETLLTGTYSLEEVEGEDTIILTYNTLAISNGKKQDATYDEPNILFKSDNGNTLMIPGDYFYDESGIASGEIDLNDWTTELQLVEGTDGLLADYRKFYGDYHIVDHTPSKFDTTIRGYRFFIDGTFEYYGIKTYEILNNHELLINNDTYQYHVKEDGAELSIWIKDREDNGIWNFEKVGTTQAVDVEILNAYVSFDETKSNKIYYSDEKNGESKEIIDVVTPLYMGYEFTIKSTGFRGIKDLVYDIVPSETLEKYLSDKMFPENDNVFRSEFYNNFNSLYDFYPSTLEGVDTDLKADGMAAFTKRYNIGYTEESVEKYNEILKNQTFSRNEREKLSQLMTDVTFVISTGEDTEIARIQFGPDGKNDVNDDQLIFIEQTELTKELYKNEDLLNAAALIMSEFQTGDSFKGCNLKEVRYVESRTYEYYQSTGKKIVVFETDFITGIGAGPGFGKGRQYTYNWTLYQTLDGWIIESCGQG